MDYRNTPHLKIVSPLNYLVILAAIVRGEEGALVLAGKVGDSLPVNMKLDNFKIVI